MNVNPLAGKPAEPSMLVNVPKLVTAYFAETPEASVPAQRVAFGTSGHRGSAFDKAFNERHILAISQAICLYRARQKIDGPLFLGMDTHALSVPALASALEVLSANGVEVMLASGDEYTPTPAVSHAILSYNRGRKTGFVDGIVITPSHNPPHDGGFKYNPPHGGPAEEAVTGWIEVKANEFLESGLREVNRIPYEKALRATTTHRHDYLNAYVADLGNVIDMEILRGAGLNLGVDPLGGAGVHYWEPIADYDMLLTEHLVQGVDVWINTPRRPWEASGTSGMKVLVNGGINLSELDGWWAEAYLPEVGWALGDDQEHGDNPTWDAAEAEALYNLLERQIVPDIHWFSPCGGLPNWANSQEKTFGCLIQEDERRALFLMFNAGTETVDFVIPPTLPGTAWHRTVDTSCETPQDFFAADEEPLHTYRLSPRTSAILLARSASVAQCQPASEKSG